jgi:DNA polymerase I-like protein with 3'-5' exonuclease and polymerase domains
VGQIHDSIVGDVVEKELEEYVALAREVMTKKIREAWKWVIIPLEAEVEVTPVGGSWVEKKEWKNE